MRSENDSITDREKILTQCKDQWRGTQALRSPDKPTDRIFADGGAELYFLDTENARGHIRLGGHTPTFDKSERQD
jgi:hypothetical protein